MTPRRETLQEIQEMTRAARRLLVAAVVAAALVAALFLPVILGD